MNLNLVMVS